jgi:thioredoxin-dependent peroxiredoxin
MALAWAGRASAAEPVKVGDTAPDFTLKTLDDHSVQLDQVLKTKPVVLVMLRGWPGYQCPFCTTQVLEYVAHAAEFTAQGAQVLMVYPGPAADLKAHAQDFLKDKNWPKDFIFVIDPDYSFTNRYGLRWEGPKETAYPSTLVVDQTGVVQFVYISHKHGDRVKVAAALEALGKLK